MKTKFECRYCGFKFEVDGNRTQAMCIKCKKNVNLLWQPLKAGDKIVDKSNYVGRFK